MPSNCAKHCLIVAILFLCSLSTPIIGQEYDRAPDELTVMTWNVEWLYDHYSGDNKSKVAKENTAPTRQYWLSRAEGVAEVIANSGAHIIALQEIEGDQTLEELKRILKQKHNLSYRYAFIQGTDSYLEQDVGILMRSGLVSYRRNEQSSTMYQSGKYSNISKHLIAEFRWSDVNRPLTIMTVHYRARSEKEDVRVKQAKLSRLWLEEPLAAGHDVIIMGDFNSEHPAGTRAGDIAELAGQRGDAPMFDLLANLPDPRTPTHLLLNKQFDRIMVSQSLIQDESGKDWSFAGIEVLDRAVIRGKKDDMATHWDNRDKTPVEELDLSDHHPVVAKFRLR